MESKGQGISVETILLFNLEALITKYETDLFNNLIKKEYERCQDILTQFCMELLDLSDQEQLFIARTFFISIITDTIRIQTRKNQLQPKTLSYAYESIAKIEKWDNISAYILAIPSFMNRLTTYIIADHVLFEGNIHVEKALQLIHHHLKNKQLSVHWLAKQLDISTTHLANVFKCQVGETISSYIMKRKIEEITFELTHTTKSLKEIRKMFGFSSDSYFIQFFKKLKGVTPLQFRQRVLFSDGNDFF